MAGVVLENISTKKLIAICVLLFSFSLLCFILGGIAVPQVVHTQVVSGNWCKRSGTKWYSTRLTQTCKELSGPTDSQITEEKIGADDVIFSFEYPLPHDGQELNMSRLFMYHTTVLTFDITYKEDHSPDQVVNLLLEVSIAHSDNNGNWVSMYENVTVLRQLRCQIDGLTGGEKVRCDALDLFEIGSMPHQKYLVNIRLPTPTPDYNTRTGPIQNIDLVWFAQTGGFTTYFLVIKTVCFAMILPLTIWNWKRVADLNRPFFLLEKLLLSVACSAIILNLPVDWLALVMDMPFILLWGDIRQGVFLTVLLSFWIIFTGEHMADGVKRGQWSGNWKHLLSVVTTSLLMFVFDIYERGVRMVNPFYSLRSTAAGETLGKAFLGIAIAAGILYFFTLLVFIIKATYHIWRKRSAFTRTVKGLRLHYMELVYRFFFSLTFTGVCCLLTIISFAIGQFYESNWKWNLDDNVEEEMHDHSNTAWITKILKHFEINTAFQLGVYGLWNVYAMSMLIFYAPSHKKPLTVPADDLNRKLSNDEQKIGAKTSENTSSKSSENSENSGYFGQDAHEEVEAEKIERINSVTSKVDPQFTQQEQAKVQQASLESILKREDSIAEKRQQNLQDLRDKLKALEEYAAKILHLPSQEELDAIEKEMLLIIPEQK